MGSCRRAEIFISYVLPSSFTKQCVFHNRVVLQMNELCYFFLTDFHMSVGQIRMTAVVLEAIRAQ